MKSTHIQKNSRGSYLNKHAKQAFDIITTSTSFVARCNYGGREMQLQKYVDGIVFLNKTKIGGNRIANQWVCLAHAPALYACAIIRMNKINCKCDAEANSRLVSVTRARAEVIIIAVSQIAENI